jgi:predicted nuclease of restriction endonuclease-like (RecB) superfamily
MEQNAAMTETIPTKDYAQFLAELKNRVASSRYQAARVVNKELILLYHHIGTEILKRQEQHGWGAKIIDQLSKDLGSSFPEMKGFSPRNLKYMRKFAEEYPDLEFVQQVAAQLPWSYQRTSKRLSQRLRSWKLSSLKILISHFHESVDKRADLFYIS